MVYDEQLENRIFSYRAGRRAVLVANLDFRVHPERIEAIIRSTPDMPDLTFFWPQQPAPYNSAHKHKGFVVCGFATRPLCNLAIPKLEHIDIRGRPVQVQRLQRRPRLPQSQHTSRNATTFTGPPAITGTSAATPAVEPPRTGFSTPSSYHVPAREPVNTAAGMTGNFSAPQPVSAQVSPPLAQNIHSSNTFSLPYRNVSRMPAEDPDWEIDNDV